MSTRSITVKQGYYAGEQRMQNRSFHVDGYSSQVVNTPEVNRIPFGVKRVLSPEIDIFSALPSFVFDNKHAKMFLDEMKRALINIDKADLEGVSLTRLMVTEHTDMTLVIEWIFNYFRLYFSFDKEEGDFFGEVSNDPENGKFHNTFNKMLVSDYAKVAAAEVMYAIMMAGGETE